MKIKSAALVMLAAIAWAPQTIAEIPEPAEIVEKVLAAAGGEPFEKLGVLVLEVQQEETRNDGTNFIKEYKVFIDTSNLKNLRAEYPGEVVVGHNGAGGWSTVAGVLDDRRQTPTMARKSLYQTIFPLILPFSLNIDGVWVKEVREIFWQDRYVWVLTIPFGKGFFVNPVLDTNWYMVVSKEDYSVLATEFIPSAQYRRVSPEGVRYRVLKTEDFSGALVPAQVLAIGVDVSNEESGHHRVTKIKSSVRPWDPSLFLSPAQLEALEED